MPPLTSRRRAAVLATVCLAVFAINLDTTIVNVALPALSRQLSAGTSTLQWVVDGYSLAFAAGAVRCSCSAWWALPPRRRSAVFSTARRCWYFSGS